MNTYPLSFGIIPIIHEQLQLHKAEQYWQQACQAGLIRGVRRFKDSNRQIGRAFEYLGRAMIMDLFPSRTITTPQDTAVIRMALTPEQDEHWNPRFPDGLILQRINGTGYELEGFVEYKMPNVEHVREMQDQLGGFYRLYELLSYQNAGHGRGIMRRWLGKDIKPFLVNEKMPVYYVVPQERTIEDICHVLDDTERIRELKLPMTTTEIRNRINALGRKNCK